MTEQERIEWFRDMAQAPVTDEERALIRELLTASSIGRLAPNRGIDWMIASCPSVRAARRIAKEHP